MARDLFVYWQDDKPSQEVLGLVLRNYLGEIGEIEFKNSTWFCTLPGKRTHPFKNVPGFAQKACVDGAEERWFEVFWHDDEINAIDIITRQQDDFTNAVAVGFAEICVLSWKARKGDE